MESQISQGEQFLQLVQTGETSRAVYWPAMSLKIGQTDRKVLLRYAVPNPSLFYSFIGDLHFLSGEAAQATNKVIM